LCAGVSQHAEQKSKGVRAQQSLNVEDMGGFPTPELMEMLVKIEADKSLKQQLALKKLGPIRDANGAEAFAPSASASTHFRGLQDGALFCAISN